MVEPPAELSEEQEARRRDGLRILARIIARQYLERLPGWTDEVAPLTPGEVEPGSAPESQDGPMLDMEDAK